MGSYNVSSYFTILHCRSAFRDWYSLLDQQFVNNHGSCS